MRIAHYVIFTLSTLILGTLLFGKMSAQSETLVYAFAYQPEYYGAVTINLLDVAPDQITSTAFQVEPPLGDEIYLRDAALSPAGAWIALLFKDRHRMGYLRLVNIQTREIRDVSGVVYFYEYYDLYLGEQEHLRWSPDGEYLAFNASADEVGIDTYIYNVRDDLLINLTVDDKEQHQFAWSANSSQLVVQTEGDCQYVGCEQLLQIFEVNGQLTGTILVDPIPLTSNISAAALCALEWSPDDQHIAFSAGCAAGVNLSSEVYIADVQDQTVERITNIISDNLDDLTIYVQAGYELEWVNSHQLLIGAGWTIGTFNTSTFIYDLEDQRLTEISANVLQNTRLFAGELAFTQLAPSVTPDDLSRSVSTDIAILSDTSTLNVVYSHLPGCDLDWSPDGELLAYSVLPTTRRACGNYGFAEVLAFVQRTSGEIQIYPIPDDVDSSVLGGQTIFPLGWVVLNTVG